MARVVNVAKIQKFEKQAQILIALSDHQKLIFFKKITHRIFLGIGTLLCPGEQSFEKWSVFQASYIFAIGLLKANLVG